MSFKQLGKIRNVKLGWGGYQDAQFGLWINIGGDGWGISPVSKGVWQGTPSNGSKWSMADKLKIMGEIMLEIEGYLTQAKVDCVEKLVGIPVEITMTHEFGRIETWRILTEVL